MTNRSDAFGRLLKAGISSIVNCEGKTAASVEVELGAQIGVSGDSIQRYKAGHLPPEARTVEILATAAVQRGFLDREWLQRFLHAARYPFADTLLDQLRPIGPARPRPPRVYHNLPAPTYSQFIMRAEAFAEVNDGLQQRSAVALIVGLGGNGKTSLAREVAAHCLQDNGDTLRFDAVVWVSDKDRPGTTNLSVVLDEIARTLDYPGFTQFAHDEKLYEVGQLLKRQRVLVVIDNFETITDGALLAWLLRLPEPSKALITSREKHRGLWSSWLVELRGMRETEAQEFIDQRLRVLRIAQLVSDQAQLEPLLVATGGNPKAIEIALGLVKHERRPLQHVVDDLYAARGDLFDDLFTRAWALLDEAARRVLLVMTFFPTSASGKALSATADVHGFAFDRANERLTDLALLDVQQTDLNSPPRYTLHPLVRAFAGARLVEQADFEKGARKRWIGWYVQLASEVGYCWDNLRKLDLLDGEQETAYAALTWACQQQMYKEALLLAKGIEYFYAVRGLLDQKLTINLHYAEAAQRVGDDDAELHALASQVHILSMQGNFRAAEVYLPRLEELKWSSSISEHAHDLVIATALYWIAQDDIDAAQHTLQEALNRAEEIPIYAWIGYQRWFANCLYLKGELVTAQAILRDVLGVSLKHGYELGVTFTQTRLARIALELRNFDEAEATLIKSSARAYRYHDRRDIAEIQSTYARLYTLRGDLPAARAALAEAIDLFERLGMRREFAEARAELASLDDRERAALPG